MSMNGLFRLRSCQRCGGDAYLDFTDGPEWRCLQCARPVPTDAPMYGLVASNQESTNGLDGSASRRGSRDWSPADGTSEAIVISVDEEGIYETLVKEAGSLTFIPKARLSLRAINRALKGEE